MSLGKECEVTLDQLSGLKIEVKLDICLKSLTGIFSSLVSYTSSTESHRIKNVQMNLNYVSRSKFEVLSEMSILFFSYFLYLVKVM